MSRRLSGGSRSEASSAYGIDGGCDGTAHDWSADLAADDGKGGNSLAVAFGFAYGSFECADGFTGQTLHLKGGR